MEKRSFSQPSDTSSLVASDSAVRRFRANLKVFELKAETSLSGSALNRLTRETIRTLGKPYRAVVIGIKGVRRYGGIISEKYGVSKLTQFMRLFIDHWLSETTFEDFYLHRFYFPMPLGQRRRHITYWHIITAHQILGSRLAPSDRELLDSKDKFANACKARDLPTLPIVAEFVGGQLTSGKLPSADLFAKPAYSLCGWNSRSLQYDPSNTRFLSKEWRFHRGMDRPELVTTPGLSKAEIVAALSKQSQRGKVIVQPRLRNHSHFAPITNGALVTIRIVTCRAPSGDIDLLPPAIRIPTETAIVDNFDSGGIIAPLDLDAGKIIGPGMQRDPTTAVRSVAAHPDTGFPLIEFVVPRWSEVVDLALRAHLSFPSFYSVGWDIAFLQEGPVLLEGNRVWGPDLITLSHAISISDTAYIQHFSSHVTNLEMTDGPPARGGCPKPQNSDQFLKSQRSL